MPNEALTFYSERNSASVFEDVERMYSTPEAPLTEEQKEKVHQFAHELYQGRAGELRRDCAEDLEEVAGMSVDSDIANFYVGYFHTPAGREDLIKLGISGDPTDLEQKLIGSKNNLNEEERKQIAKRSLDWYKGLLSEALAADPSLDDAYLEQEPAVINFNPRKLLDKVSLLGSHRKFYRQVRSQLKANASSVDEPVWRANNLILDQILARANNLLAEQYAKAFMLAKQLQASYSSESQAYQSEIQKLLPTIHRAVTRVRNEKNGDIQSLADFQQTMARRIDFLSQGVDWGDDGISPISQELIDFAIEIESQKESLEAKPRFDKATVEKMKKEKWAAERYKDFCEAVIGGWGILSSEKVSWTEAEKRDGPAADKKWQVVINPRSDSLEVDRIKKLLKVPQSFNRNLVKSLSVAAHELAHLAQAESDSALSEAFPLAKVGGRRTVGLREGGAVDQEAKVYAALGEERPTRLGYLYALRAKINGASHIKVAREFYKHYEDEAKLDEDERAENRKLSADRSLRLYRTGGYNSQPLDYIEGEFFKRVLDAKKLGLGEAVLVSGATFNFADAAKLHQLGLYNLPTETAWNPAEDVLAEFEKNYQDKLN